MREEDAIYFGRRAVEEQAAAQRAGSDQARLRHDELAMMYRFRAAMLSQRPDCWADALERESALASQVEPDLAD